MKLTIRSHHATVPASFESRAEQKLARLERLLPRVEDVVVEVAHEDTRSAADRYAVQVTVHSAGSILRAEERAAEPETALDVAADVLARQARRHKKRLYDRHQAHTDARERTADAANRADEAPPRDADDGHEETYVAGNVVRVKRFDAKPMSEAEALAQMDLVGHDFFLFLDARTNDFALLYKRKSGDYGLLAPARG